MARTDPLDAVGKPTEADLAAVAGEVWRALAAVGLGGAFGAVIGAGAQAATERWT